eukprot:gene3856-7016_t
MKREPNFGRNTITKTWKMTRILTTPLNKTSNHDDDAFAEISVPINKIKLYQTVPPPPKSTNDEKVDNYNFETENLSYDKIFDSLENFVNFLETSPGHTKLF